MIGRQICACVLLFDHAFSDSLTATKVCVLDIGKFTKLLYASYETTTPLRSFKSSSPHHLFQLLQGIACVCEACTL